MQPPVGRTVPWRPRLYSGGRSEKNPVGSRDPVARKSGTLIGGRRAKWAVLALWVVLIGVFAPFGLKLPQVTNDELVLPSGSETAHVDQLLAKRFPGGNQQSVYLVYRRAGGLDHCGPGSASPPMRTVRRRASAARQSRPCRRSARAPALGSSRPARRCRRDRSRPGLERGVPCPADDRGPPQASSRRERPRALCDRHPRAPRRLQLGDQERGLEATARDRRLGAPASDRGAYRLAACLAFVPLTDGRGRLSPVASGDHLPARRSTACRWTARRRRSYSC